MWSLVQRLRRMPSLPLEADWRAFGVGFLLLLPLYLAPLLVVRYLPGLDLGFHLSMADMLRKNDVTGSPYAPHYVGTIGVFPYALHYWALTVFGSVLPLMEAHRLVIITYVMAMPLSMAALLGICGRSRIPALLGFPLAYNLTLHYGFVSFALSLPVLALMLAALARLLLVEHGMWRSAVATAALALMLFLCHLQNFLYGVCAALSFLVLSGAPWRRRVVGAATFLPATGALLLWHFTARFMGDAGDQRRTFAFGWNLLKAERLGDLGTRSLWDDFRARLGVVPEHVLRGFYDNVDVRATKALLVVLGAYLVLGMLGAFRPLPDGRRPRLRIAGVVVFLGACLAYFGLPHHMAVLELMTFYPRFSVLMVMMGLLLIPAGLRAFEGPARYLVMLPVLLMAGLYGEDLTARYRLYNQELNDFAQVMKHTQPGRRALGLVFDRTSRVMRIESALVSLPNLYPALRPAAASMAPIPYCGMRHMPCRMKDPPPAPGSWAPQTFDPKAAITMFDYFFMRLPPRAPLFGPVSNQVRLLAQSGSWVVYEKITPPRAATAQKR